MIGVSLLTFALFNIIPGDACVLRLGFGSTPETLEDCREQHGLNRPLFPMSLGSEPPFVDVHESQYGGWLGISSQSRTSGQSLAEGGAEVSTELQRRLPITMELMIMTIIFALVLGVPPGVLSAIRPNTPHRLGGPGRERPLAICSVFLSGDSADHIRASVVRLDAPTIRYRVRALFEDPWINLQQFVFPSLVLSVGIAAVIMRLTRSAMLEVLRNDYIRTAWSKGLRERTVVWRHALKNALIPVITLVGLQIGALIGGAVIIESVYNLNGVGQVHAGGDHSQRPLRGTESDANVRHRLCAFQSDGGHSLRLVGPAHSL